MHRRFYNELHQVLMISQTNSAGSSTTMILSFILCVFLGVAGCAQVKRGIWYMFVDDFGHPIAENYVPQVVSPNYPVAHYPVQRQWPVHNNMLNEQNIHLTKVGALARDPYVGNPQQICKYNEFQCSSPIHCIPKKKRCNNYVDCTDGTDEYGCQCASRLHPSKFCDFFDDCPNGEDELGCFGCDKDEFSCYRNKNEYEQQPNNQNCYKSIDKCDRVAQCPNGKDEIDCSVISEEIQPPTHALYPTIDGILYHHNRGSVYPVCRDDFRWSSKVCASMMGANFGHVEGEYVATRYVGQYVYTVMLEDAGLYTFSFEDKCPGNGSDSSNVVLRVKCIAKNACGYNQFDSVENERTSRVASGHEANPGSNPWLVGLFMNGIFACGGNIISNKWVLTAAHCLYINGRRSTMNDYWEVRAGIHRLFSFSHNEQAVRVDRGMIHEKYNRTTLENDIALLELEHTLTFNKWVQPICLPTSESVGDSADRGWILGPHNSICKIAGWGGHTWRGPYPVDHQMEANVPIISGCNQTNQKLICAGYEQGGADACVGDSGGPFVCQSAENEKDIYLAGIVTAGYNNNVNNSMDVKCGEKDAYGLYTGLTWYILWIEQMQDNETYGIHFRQTCPGVKCSSTNHCAIRNGIVDCIGGEDEI